METIFGRGRVALQSAAYSDVLRENARLRALLKGAEVIAARYSTLLREGDHRIKNSLQIVSSLMNLQAGRQENTSVQEALHTAAARVQSIARIHDALQKGGGEDEVDLSDVLRTMCVSMHAVAGDSSRISVHFTSDQILAPVGLAQPIALAVNELVVNALRHACPDGRAGTIRVSAVEIESELLITVADDGVGLPPGYADGVGYGMKLVRMMVQQVGGELHVEGRGGASFTIVAPMPDKSRPAIEHATVPGTSAGRECL